MDLRIKDILAERGITLKEFSMESGISQSNLSNYLKGNISPTLETLKKIASHLNVDIVELFKAKDSIEFYAKINGEMYRIDNEDIINIIKSKKK